MAPTGSTTASSAFEPALGLMAEMLTKPAFDSSAIERRKSAQAAAARRVAQAPVTIPRHLFYESIYGDADPFARSLVPTEVAIRSITRADVVHFYDVFVSPRTTTLAIAGDVSDSCRARCRDACVRDVASASAGAVRRRLDQRQRPTASHTHLPARRARRRRTSVPVRRRLGPSRIDTDAVATEAFAAVASARLQETLREKRSFIYSSTTGITWRRGRGSGVRRQHDRQRAEGRQRARRVAASPA